MADPVGTGGASEFLDQMSEPPSIGAVVTSFSGSSFCVSSSTGDIDGRHPQGWFIRDRRMLSDLVVRLDDELPELLMVTTPSASSAVFVARARPPRGESEASLLLERRRVIGRRFREELVLRNLSTRPRPVRISIAVRADFADVFAVKESRVRALRPTSIQAEGSAVTIARHDEAVRVQLEHAEASTDGLEIVVLIPPRDVWSGMLEVATHPIADRGPVVASRPISADELVVDDPLVGAAVRRSATDLAGLRIDDPDDPDSFAIAAGAPWFMALFGRDSLWTALMTLPLDPGIAKGTLSMLAARQGTQDVPATEEQPGRILHETRLTPGMPLVLGGGATYYGTVDASMLFVMLLGEYARWTGDLDFVRRMLPHADAALNWARRDGDADGDGFVEYERGTAAGLLNQGWKDSWNGVTFADGRLAEPSIALCEVQAYWYAALVARADLADALGAPDTAAGCRAEADALRRRFEEAFWIEPRGHYALALDGAKAVVDSNTSNQGHVLWCGIASPERAAQVAAHLVSTSLFSGWGIRTLAADMAAYNPLSYHNGSVWPHDSAIAAAGLARYGHSTEAAMIARALFDAAAMFDGRLPELFAGFSREDFAVPIPYPTSCSPQAWASAAPLLLVRALIGLEPELQLGRVAINPTGWPDLPLQVSGLSLGGRRVSARTEGDRYRLSGLHAGIDVEEVAPWAVAKGT
jgi:glycogen debranching enzyme